MDNQNVKVKRQRLYETLLEYYLDMGHQFKLQIGIQIFFLIFGLLQASTFLATPIFNDNNQPRKYYLYSLIYLSRPDLAFSYYFELNNLYLVPLTFHLIFEIFPILIRIINTKLNIIDINNRAYRIYYDLVSIYSQIYLQYTYIIFSCMLITSLNHNIKYDSNTLQLLPNLIIISVTFIFVFLSMLIRVPLYLETINLELNVFQFLNLTLFDVLKYVLHIIQLISYGLIDIEETGIIFQTVLILFIQIIQLVQIFSLQTSNIYCIKITIFVSSLNTVYSGIILIDWATKIQENYQEVLVLMLTPILIFILYQIQKTIDDNCIQNIQIENRLTQLKYYFSKLINNDIQDSNFQFTILYSKQNRKLHYDLCIIYNDIEPNYCRMQQVITQNMLNEFHKILLKKYKKQIKSEIKINQVSNILHYLSILNSLSFNNLAFQQSTSLLHDKQQSQFLKQSAQHGVNSEHQSIQNYKTKFSHTDNFDKSQTSKSQEVNEFQQQQVKNNNKYIISNKQELSTLQLLKIKLINKNIHLQMKTQLQTTNTSTSAANLKLGVQLFLDREAKNEKLRNQVFSFINRKLQFFILLQNSKGLKSQKLYRNALGLSRQLHSLDLSILQLYEQFPSSRLQSVACFFQAELINNVLEAYRFKNNQSLSDEKLMNVHKNISTTFFSSSMVYLQLKIEQTTQELYIENSSESAPTFFEQPPNLFKQQCLIYEILPEFIRNEHKLLVQRFLQTGNSKFYLNTERGFVKLQNQIVKPIQFFFDFQLNKNNELQFYSFFQELQINNSFIILDINGIIGGITRNFFQRIGYQLQNNNLIDNFDFTQIPISLIFPEFNEFRSRKQVFVTTKMHFLKQEFLLKPEVSKLLYSLKTKNSSINWQNLDNMNAFEVELQIQYNSLYGEYYIMIQLIEFKQLLITQAQISIPDEKIDEIFNPSDISESEAIVDNINTFQVQQWNSGILANEEIQIIQNEIQLMSPSDNNNNLVNLMSPNQSMFPLNDNSQIPFKSAQQQYYNMENRDISISNTIKADINQEEISQLDKNIMVQIVVQLGADKQYITQKAKEIESSTSSLAGIKRSQFYKKYEFIHSVLKPTYPISLKLFFFFSIMQFLVCSIFSIISLVEVTSDLNRFIEEIDMIQLHSGLMVPHDICVVLRVSLVSYQAYLAEKAITSEQYKQLVEPLYLNQRVGYVELQENFILQFDNRYLQKFFNNRNFTISFMYRNGAEVYEAEMNIREALYTMYSYYYTFLLHFERRLPPANMTFQVFQFANFYTLHYWLEELTQDIERYSNERSVQVSNKWVTILISFLMISFMLIILALYYYHFYSLKYDKFLNLFTYCSNENLSRDIDRYKVLIKILNQNTEAVFNYKFDLNVKESFLLQEKQKNNKDQLNNRFYKNKEQLKERNTKLQRCLCVFILWGVFFGLSTLSTTQTTTYLNNYTQTTSLYKLIQDLTLTSGTTFLYRNIRLLWGNFTYLTEFDYNQSYQFIYNGIDNILKFQKLYTFFDENNYQISAEFVDYFVKVSKTSLCVVLNETELGFLEQYCDKSFEGNLHNGLVPVLGFMKKSIETQMAINNYTKRASYLLYENEGSLIITRALQKMTRLLKSGMLDITNASKNQTNNISIIYFVYALLLSTILLVWIQSYLKLEYTLIQKFIQIIPSSIIYFDDQFERNARVLIAFQEK